MIFLSWELLVLPECIVRTVLPLLHLISVQYCLFSSVQFTCIVCMLSLYIKLGCACVHSSPSYLKCVILAQFCVSVTL